MNKQDIFNTIANGLLGQMKKCQKRAICMYEHKTKEGEILHCGIGFIIPEGHAAMSSSEDVKTLLQNYPDLEELWGVSSYNDQEFLEDFQSAHDDCDINDWKIELNKIAHTYKLDPVS